MAGYETLIKAGTWLQGRRLGRGYARTPC